MKKAILVALVALFCMLPFAQSQSSYIVVDTGQSRCYDNSRGISCPQLGQPFYGQDAQYNGVQPVYQDNGDDTITDLNTGLMWQKTPGSKVTYTEAGANARTFQLGGYDDWRLPSIKELYSLILFSGTDPSGPNVSTLNPFINTKYFDFEYGDTRAGERLIDAQYWSSTEYVGTVFGGSAAVFGVNFADGRIKGYGLTGSGGQPMREFVRYVRGNRDYGVNNFINNGDGTITDLATGLMWMKADSGKGMNWEDALAWVQQKNEEAYLGYNDWRLPNAKELQSIVDYTRSPSTTNSAAIDSMFDITSITDEGGKRNYPFFWTSTTHISANGSGLFAVYVAFGEALGYMQTRTGNYELMDVHGAGAQRSDPKSGDPNDWPHGNGPQGDVVRIYNYVRCVRDVSTHPPQAQPPETQSPTGQPSQTESASESPTTHLPEQEEEPGWEEEHGEPSMSNLLYVVILALIVIIILLIIAITRKST